MRRLPGAGAMLFLVCAGCGPRPAAPPVVAPGAAGRAAPPAAAFRAVRRDAEVALPQPPANCPTTELEHQKRGHVKHRSPPAGVTAVATSITDVLGWDYPPSASTQMQSQVPVDAHENTVYSLRAEVRLWKFEGNDCDIHLEVAEPGSAPDADRIIVEVPNDGFASAARDAILQALVDAGEGHPGPVTHPVVREFVGYGFCDLPHYMVSNHRGNRHGSAQVGTLWEIHPVWKVE